MSAGIDVEHRLAHVAGRLAGRLGRPLTVCPYRPGVAGRQRVLALWFVRGWLSTSPHASR